MRQPLPMTEEEIVHRSSMVVEAPMTVFLPMLTERTMETHLSCAGRGWSALLAEGGDVTACDTGLSACAAPEQRFFLLVKAGALPMQHLTGDKNRWDEALLSGKIKEGRLERNRGRCREEEQCGSGFRASGHAR